MEILETIEIRRYTYQEERVAELAPKVAQPYGNYGSRITSLHDHERELLAEFVLEHEPDNENAQLASKNQTEAYNVFDLGVDAYRLINGIAPELINHDPDDTNSNLIDP